MNMKKTRLKRKSANEGHDRVREHDRGKPCHYYTLRHGVAYRASPSIVVTGLAPVMLLASTSSSSYF